MKLVVSDLDGTLLQKNEYSLSKNVKKSIYAHLCAGNAFAVASGRNYTELKKLFSEFENEIYFICNDGTLGVHKENIFFNMPLNKKLFESFSKFTAHGKYVTYVKSTDSMFIRNISKKYHGHILTIESIYDIYEDIYKISDYARDVKCPLPIVYKDYSMNEYVSENADKAHALKQLMLKLAIQKENSYVFGDNINDLGMFSVCGKSFAVANATPKVKKSADRITQNIEQEILNLV